MDITFFVSPDELRAWLTHNHQTVPELYIGFHRKNSGFSGITYAEALDEALCFGWIDGAFEPAQENKFRRHKRARSFWEAQPPGYKRVAIHWVTSAKQQATRTRRLTQLIADSAGGLRLGQVTGERGKG